MKLFSKAQKVIKYIDSRSHATRNITYLGLKLCCVVLLAVLLLIVVTGEVSVYTYESHLLIKELLSVGWLVILISIFGAALFEDLEKRG